MFSKVSVRNGLPKQDRSSVAVSPAASVPTCQRASTSSYDPLVGEPEQSKTSAPGNSPTTTLVAESGPSLRMVTLHSRSHPSEHEIEMPLFVTLRSANGSA